MRDYNRINETKRGNKKEKHKEVGKKIGRSAVAALIQPPSLFLPASVVVKLMGNISATVETEACSGTRDGKTEVAWEVGDLIDEWAMERKVCMCQL